jgi:hypothetical protein
MWKLANVSVRGSAHHKTRLPCQDWSALRVVGPDRNVVICALSDGASSARFAQEAAHLITEGSLNYFTRELAKQPDQAAAIAGYNHLDGKLMIQEQQRLLVHAAEERGAPLQDFSATLLVAVVHPEVSLFLQVGDGCWSAARWGVIGAVTWPTQGEYVGQTDFVTSMSAARSFQMSHVHGPLDFIAGISDGLERLALDMAGCVPHPPFFWPLAQTLRDRMDAETFQTVLHQFLESDRVCSRTDDDKSLVLVVNDG